ncbi:MAG: glutamyl-tRNA reductase [Gammaproteobacteria bacterium]|nr:glutamyl-tRNA reductase [Gammaproteobacteria bacterium]
MTLFAFGINHKTAPLAIRERVNIGPEAVGIALRDLADLTSVQEAVILSTCNRTELYCGLTGSNGTRIALDWFKDYHRLADHEVQPYVYTHETRGTVRHVLRVAAGLDSMVLGEPQILGQVKDAYHKACETGTVGKRLGRLFQHSFSVAKQVRTDTAIGSSPVSVAFAAVRLAHQIFDNLAEQTALLIGAGETIELAARHLRENGIKRLVVANRTVERARELANELDGYAIALPEIPAHLAEADIVISSTASPLPILGKGSVEQAIRRRRHKPILMVDIAVPRDIEPEVGELEDIYLYTVDDLRDIVDEGLRSRQEAAVQAEEIIDLQVSHFLSWLRSQDVVDSIVTYRQQSEAARDEVLAKAERMLAKGEAPERVVDYLAHVLTNKLIHTPCTELRKASAAGDTDTVSTGLRLLGITAKRYPPR